METPWESICFCKQNPYFGRSKCPCWLTIGVCSQLWIFFSWTPIRNGRYCESFFLVMTHLVNFSASKTLPVLEAEIFENRYITCGAEASSREGEEFVRNVSLKGHWIWRKEAKLDLKKPCREQGANLKYGGGIFEITFLKIDVMATESDNLMTTTDAGLPREGDHDEKNQSLKKGYMLETSWMWRGDNGLVGTQLGCGHCDLASIPFSTWDFLCSSAMRWLTRIRSD